MQAKEKQVVLPCNVSSRLIWSGLVSSGVNRVVVRTGLCLLVGWQGSLVWLVSVAGPRWRMYSQAVAIEAEWAIICSSNPGTR